MREDMLDSDKAALLKGELKKQKEHTLEEKKQQRQQELVTKYKIMRTLSFQLAVKVRLNLPEEVEIKKEPEPVVQKKK